MRHFIKIILIIFLIWIGAFTIISYANLGINQDEVVVIDDNEKLIELIEKNTPVKIEITDDKWGKAVLEEPKTLFKIWNILNNLDPYPDKYVANQDEISGYIYFIDGSRQFFTISDRFQLGEFLLGSMEEEIDVRELYRILQHTLQTKKNLINMIKQADAIYLYKAGDYYDPDSPSMINIQGESRLKFLDFISNSSIVKDSNKLNDLLFDRGYQPVFYISLAYQSQDPIVISVISQEFFNVMDTNLLNRNVIYFTGNLFDFCNEMLAVNSIDQYIQ